MVEFLGLSNTEIYAWILLPILIFVARICDVSIGTLRIIFVSKGIKYFAALAGFFEILIWLMAIGQIMQNFSNVYYYIFYAGGFAVGTLVGITIENKISIGIVGIRIITRKDAIGLIESLRSTNFVTTVLDADGPKGKVKLIFTVTNRQNISEVIKIVKKYNPGAFYSIEDIRQVSKSLPSNGTDWHIRQFLGSIKGLRKSK
ncbi:MAG: DUF2179 domain-containing protein [Candidatus Thermoplasmatota archaeon]|nr:DUF2179 domain-containing protein [Candidatus Thermoplasmatota archaeon]